MADHQETNPQTESPGAGSSAEAAQEPSSGKKSTSYLIVGLGNPGRVYRLNRHNAGFMVLDRLAEELGISFTRMQGKALVTDARSEGLHLILVKPQTYMNESGQAATALIRFYKIPLENFLVVHDDLDLPLGTLRMRPGGGAGGQRGLKSIINQLGTPEFPRLRVGIGRPPGRMDPAAYVLQNYSTEEMEIVPLVLDHGVKAVSTFVHEGIQAAMTRHNTDVLSQ
jgi:PTH1 family peptidyl-tRNA hydrolase